jgi:hypothetical protein
MSTNRKATMAKRARELAQKDRVKDREQRRAERQARSEARAASGIVGPEVASETVRFQESRDDASPQPQDSNVG